MTELESGLVTAALVAIPPACFWIAWELRGIRERVGGIQSQLESTRIKAQAAMSRADFANRRLDLFERVIKGENIHLHKRKHDEKA